MSVKEKKALNQNNGTAPRTWKGGYRAQSCCCHGQTWTRSGGVRRPAASFFGGGKCGWLPVTGWSLLCIILWGGFGVSCNAGVHGEMRRAASADGLLLDHFNITEARRKGHNGFQEQREESPPQAIHPQQNSFSSKGKAKASLDERKLRDCHQPLILTEWL